MTDDEKPPEPKWAHIGFMHPVRVCLEGKSLPIVAVTGTLHDSNPRDGGETLTIKAKWLFPANAGPHKCSATIITPVANIVSTVPTEPPK
jgi:hypothetical protein